MVSSIALNPYFWAALAALCCGAAIANAVPRRGRPSGKGLPGSTRFSLACLSLSLGIICFWAGFFLSGREAFFRYPVLLFGLILAPIAAAGMRWKLAAGLPLVFAYSFCLVFSAWILRDWSFLPASPERKEMSYALARVSARIANPQAANRPFAVSVLPRRGGTPSQFYAEASAGEGVGLLVQRVVAGGAWALLGIRSSYRVVGFIDAAGSPSVFGRVMKKNIENIERSVFPPVPGDYFTFPALFYVCDALPYRVFGELETVEMRLTIYGLEWTK